MGEAFRWDRISSWLYGVYYSVIFNLLFWIMNIPLLAFFIFVGIGKAGENLPLFFLALLPIFPAFCAILYGINKLLMKREGKPLKDFFSGYIKNAKQAFGIGGIEFLLIFMMLINIRYFSEQNLFIPLIIMIIILAVILLSLPGTCVLIVTYKFTIAALLKLGISMTIGKPVLTIGNTAAFFIVLLWFEVLPVSIVFFSISLFGIMILYMFRRNTKSMTKE